jgi:hypothetical protein
MKDKRLSRELRVYGVLSVKNRMNRTSSYLTLMTDATNTFDQARFFQEHAEQVFQVVYETCMHQIEKIKRKYL